MLVVFMHRQGDTIDMHLETSCGSAAGALSEEQEFVNSAALKPFAECNLACAENVAQEDVHSSAEATDADSSASSTDANAVNALSLTYDVIASLADSSNRWIDVEAVVLAADRLPLPRYSVLAAIHEWESLCVVSQNTDRTQIRLNF